MNQLMLSKYTRPPTVGLDQIFRALSNRNYRLFFFGQGVSLIGTWMQTIAMGWLVYRLPIRLSYWAWWVLRANSPSFL